MTQSSLDQHYNNIKDKTLLDLFSAEERAQQFTLNMEGLSFDFSKNHITAEIIADLCKHADDVGMQAAIQALLDGEQVNNTEQRPAHHSALREPSNASSTSAEVQSTLNKMANFVQQIHQQQWLGFTDKPIDNVVNIGIGGSDLGPRMVVQALTAFHQAHHIKVHFVANIDGSDLEDTLKDLDPETTLFIVASKSFSTLETLNNALSARQWILNKGCKTEQLQQHFIAISTNTTAAQNFGITENNILPIWDWVGGRYSLWSAIGLPIALAIGMDNFKQLLQGAHEMDEHFRSAPMTQNIPVIAALLSYWYSHYWGSSSHVVLPYAQRLSRLPAYLQQLDMESLGKRVNKEGETLHYPTGLVIWGTEGTNGQHSFHQLLHQGTQIIPTDFIAVKEAMSPYQDQHNHLLACCISQSQALLQGKTLAQAKQELKKQGLDDKHIDFLAPHKVIPGNKPSTTIVIKALSPINLGKLIAFYEHKVYASSVLLNINAFDQWGVELGKQLGKPLYKALTTGAIDPSWDSSTKELLQHLIHSDPS